VIATNLIMDKADDAIADHVQIPHREFGAIGSQISGFCGWQIDCAILVAVVDGMMQVVLCTLPLKVMVPSAVVAGAVCALAANGTSAAPANSAEIRVLFMSDPIEIYNIKSP